MVVMSVVRGWQTGFQDQVRSIVPIVMSPSIFWLPSLRWLDFCAHTKNVQKGVFCTKPCLEFSVLAYTFPSYGIGLAFLVTLGLTIRICNISAGPTNETSPPFLSSLFFSRSFGLILSARCFAGQNAHCHLQYLRTQRIRWNETAEPKCYAINLMLLLLWLDGGCIYRDE